MQNKAQFFNFIIHEKNKTPACYTINRVVLKYFIALLSVTLISAIVISTYLLINIKEVVSSYKEKEPKVISELKTEKMVLTQSLESLKSENENLMSKIASGENNTNAILPFFKLPLGFQDTTKQRLVTVDQINVQKSDSKTKLSFHLLNTSPEVSRKKGHIFVIMQQGHVLQIYPERQVLHDDGFLRYNFGETFGVSRFRLSSYEFNSIKNATQDTYFNIIIFSRSGDLLLKQVIGPY